MKIKPDQIKKMIEAWEPEGYSWDTTMDRGDWVVCPDSQDFLDRRMERQNHWNKVYYPLLLTRLIEAVNLLKGRDAIKVKVVPDIGGSSAHQPFYDGEPISGDIYLFIDQAKEAALRYVAEKEGIV